MGQKVSWEWHDEAQYIMYIKYTSGWTWTDHHHIIDETLAVRAQYPDDFMYIIVDMSESSFPKGSPANAQYRDVGDQALMLIVSGNTFVRSIGQMSVRFRREDDLYKFVKSVDEAHRVIAEHRTSEAIK